MRAIKFLFNQNITTMKTAATLRVFDLLTVREMIRVKGGGEDKPGKIPEL